MRLRHDDGLYDNERIPSAAELHSIFEHANLQKKVSCALMVFAGFRPQVLGNRHTNDGLRVSDLRFYARTPHPSMVGGELRC